MAEDPPWQLWRSFLAVAREGSLSAAARRLRLTQPTLGRHVEELEAALGTALFTRSQGGLAPTEAARRLLPIAEGMEASAAALLRAAQGGGEAAAGTVRITASEVMGAEVLPPLLRPVQRAHPGITLELALTNRAENLLRRDADVAVRMLRPTQEAVLARRIGTVSLRFYAHRDYLAEAGAPADVTELRRHRLIGFDRDDRSARGLTAGVMAVERGMFSVRSDSDLAQGAALRAGLGIGVMQARLAARTPELVPVLPGIAFALEVWVAMHEDQRGSAAVRAVYEGLAAGLARWVD